MPAKYRRNLPQLKDGIFLSDGGMETTLIFHDGIELPHFASCVLLETEEGRQQLRRYYEPYLSVARNNGVGFILDSASWRANPGWAPKLGYDANDLRRINAASIALLEELRAEWEAQATPLVISGAIGPAGDGYKAGSLNAAEAEDHHTLQVETFARTAADMVSGYTLNNIAEAIGVARAARAHDMPCMISFTVETDGRLVTGETLREAIEAVDADTNGYPLYYMINCAHPTHFVQALQAGEAWIDRIRGAKANASAKSHQELDDSTELDAGDPVDLGRRYQALRRSFPTMRILGGCCGTDHRHVAAICEAVLPRQALSA